MMSRLEESDALPVLFLCAFVANNSRGIFSADIAILTIELAERVRVRLAGVDGIPCL